MCLFLLISTILSSKTIVFAEEDDLGQIAPEEADKAAIIIKYYDDLDMTIPVKGSTWTLLKVADIDTVVEDGVDGLKITSLLNDEINYETTADEIYQLLEYKIIDESNISLTGKTKDGIELETYSNTTDESGTAIFDELDYGVYLGVETKAASYHLCSTPFVVSVPHTEDDGITSDVERTIMPKAVLAGDITIKKEVRGNAVSQTEKFEMVVQLPEGIYHFQYKDGVDGYIENGDTLKVAADNPVTIYNVLAQGEYKVIEKSANLFGYKTEYENAEGKVSSNTDNQVKVINNRNIFAPVDTGAGTMLVICAGVFIASLSALIILAVYRRKKGSDCK